MTVPTVTPGQLWKPWPVDQHNQVVEAANAHAAAKQGSTFDRSPADRDTDHVYLSNGSGYDADKGEAIKISDPTVSPVDDADHAAARVRHAGTNPALTDLGKFGVLDEACAKTAFGRAVASGLAYAQITVVEAWHEYADIDDTAGGRVLVSTPSGSAPAQILWKESGTGTKWALLRLANAGQLHLLGRPCGDGISARTAWDTPGSGVVQVYYYDPVTAKIKPLLSGSAYVFLTVLSNSQDRILAGGSYATHGDTYGTDFPADAAELYVVHCDRWGAWWIDVEYHSQQANAYGPLDFYAADGSRTGRNAGEATGGAYTWQLLSVNDLDIVLTGEPGLLTGFASSPPADFAFLTVNKTGDYLITCDWSGPITLAAAAKLKYDVQYQNGGSGSWASLFPQSARHAIERSSISDRTGAAMSFSRRLSAGTRIRGYLYSSSGSYHDSSGNEPFDVAFTFTKTK